MLDAGLTYTPSSYPGDSSHNVTLHSQTSTAIKLSTGKKETPRVPKPTIDKSKKHPIKYKYTSSNITRNRPPKGIYSLDEQQHQYSDINLPTEWATILYILRCTIDYFAMLSSVVLRACFINICMPPYKHITGFCQRVSTCFLFLNYHVLRGSILGGYLCSTCTTNCEYWAQ
ncbi:hypothetical protein L873DRAFT_1432876 [Choiromyces venosus 120613-1]|uniref:Uncharacterized protein n=1 Tax=Choiromyces venosus 120613-1 TaxID=1336337 RepID=A0A3N4JCJ3_9PEZI|nr:hypothetical protein L873DRAFT_1432876 [Choiromyces venosus 120613-1]